MTSTTHDAPALCENCAAPLHGQYCHDCGQSVHNPIRHAGHAIEEFFEAFWHLDGRLWRTLRDLLVPGRVGCNYLAGHRARYIPPLRLFVVLSLLTFFVGKATVHIEPQPQPGAGQPVASVDADVSGIAEAADVAAVLRERDTALQGLAEARAQVGGLPLMGRSLDQAERKVREQAQARIAELGGAAASTTRPDPTPPASVPSPAAAPDTGERTFERGQLVFNGKPWDEHDNPVDIGWLPGFGDRWLNHKIGQARGNIERMDGQPELYVQAFLGVVPTALFVLMPVFALLLKLFYLGSGRLYLEHLVVALYSHAFLLLSLLVLFLLWALGRWLTPFSGFAGGLLGWLGVALLWWGPVYLLLMQKRVYAQGWPATVAKLLVLGAVYLFLVLVAALVAFVAGIAAG